MKRREKQLIGSAVAVGLALLMALAPGVAGAAGDADVVAIHGGRAVANIYWVLDGSAGTSPQFFDYTSNATGATCVNGSIDRAGGDIEVPDGIHDTTCQLDTEATLTNVVCGTGVIHGYPNSTTIDELSGDGASPEYSIPTYTIVYAAGIGVFAAPAVADSEDGGSGVGAGVIDILPADSQGNIGPFDQAPGPGNLCLDGFTLSLVLATNA